MKVASSSHLFLIVAQQHVLDDQAAPQVENLVAPRCSVEEQNQDELDSRARWFYGGDAGFEFLNGDTNGDNRETA